MKKSNRAEWLNSKTIVGLLHKDREVGMEQMPTINMVKTGEDILKLRMKHGLSVKDLQDIFGFATPQAIYKWQQGTTLPSVDNLLVLANVFHVHIEDILVVDEAV